ncbi:CRISPR-associated endonuclease Cas1 [Metallosphaera tengchongensis]|uniref:CRISPR-associated endonuclease Cas1 n=1 Tax=Metallosphaera tengchongensis TaxID=1532350 RepID=A0A6N0NYU8_9CREN|nr:CRISPR-associated endonuclease Cas1 [Metallosphaera tengchongensis]QKR00729.1 CRISPR-associated endonuclease Cas1 [Metallosphaera tengchongensis]
MKVLVVSQHGSYVTVNKGLFLVKGKDNSKFEVSPAEVDEILLISTATISARAIQLALTHAIDIFFMNSREDVWGKVMSSSTTMTVDTRRSQYEAVVQGRGEEYGREIISAKVENQASHLLHWSRQGYRTSHKVLDQYNEATAARLYWQDLATVVPRDLKFQGRDHDSQDQFNVSLNYSYAILYNRVMRYLTLVGLDPYLGFVHKERSGNESLVYDFSEMFKPLIDFSLVKAFRQGFRVSLTKGLLDGESRAKLASLVINALEEKVKEKHDDHTKTLNQAIKSHAVRLASALRERRGYRGFRAKL